MESENLSDINFLHLGTTGVYAGLKKDIAHVCADVTRGRCIDEVCVADVIATFRLHGFDIVRREGDATDNTQPVLPATRRQEDLG